MTDNNLLIIILAFIIGYCLQGMMKNMCGGRLFEGSDYDESGLAADDKSCCGNPNNPYGKARCTDDSGEQTSGFDQHGINLQVGCWCCRDANCIGENVCTANNEEGCSSLGHCIKPPPLIDEIENFF